MMFHLLLPGNSKANNWSKETTHLHVARQEQHARTYACTKSTCTSFNKGKISRPEIPFLLARLRRRCLNADWGLFNHLPENVRAYLKPAKIGIRFWSGPLIMEILKRNIELITRHLHLQRKLQVTSTWFNWKSIKNLLTSVYQSLYDFPQAVKSIFKR